VTIHNIQQAMLLNQYRRKIAEKYANYRQKIRQMTPILFFYHC